VAHHVLAGRSIGSSFDDAGPTAMIAKLHMRVLESALPPGVKATCLVMTLFANAEGANIYPSVGRVAWLLGFHRRAVEKHLAQLRKIGVLIPTSSTSGGRMAGGRGRRVHYRIDLRALPARAPFGAALEPRPEAGVSAGEQDQRTPALDARNPGPTRKEPRPYAQRTPALGRTILESDLRDQLRERSKSSVRARARTKAPRSARRRARTRTEKVDPRITSFWNCWRSANYKTTGLTLPETMKRRERQECAEIVAMLADDDLLARAVWYFHKLAFEDAATLNIKAKSLGYFRMALPRLLEVDLRRSWYAPDDGARS
jgi:hypothetical protein